MKTVLLKKTVLFTFAAIAATVMISCGSSAYNPDGIEMVFVKGDGNGMSDFYIGKYVVTQAQWQKVTGNNPSGFKGDDLPVESVSWNDAQKFIEKLNSTTGRNYRLPTEREWIYAANGGTDTNKYEFSGSNNFGDVAWCRDNSGDRTHPVGTKKPNSLGIYDMNGNVWEWCQDRYDSSIPFRVLRGGCYSNAVSDLRPTAFRNANSPDIVVKSYGFRLALSADSE